MFTHVDITLAVDYYALVHYTDLTLCLLGNFACFSLMFFKINFFKTFYQEYHQSVKQLESRHFVGPDLGPNYLQRLSADNTSRYRVKPIFFKEVLNSSHAGKLAFFLSSFFIFFSKINIFKRCSQKYC